MVHKLCVISDDEFNSAVDVVEQQKQLCALQSTVSKEPPLRNEFDKYWSMMNEVQKVDEGDDMSDAVVPVRWCHVCKAETCQESDGYFVCTQCGEVGVPCIDSDAEWRVFSKDDQKGDKSRCGEASSSYLSANTHAEGTVISCKWKESEQMRNARQYHRWNSCQSSGRNLYVIFDELQRRAYKNGFNHMIVEDTKHLYKETTDYHLFRGVNRKGLYAYCLYHTCKKKNVPRSIKEISKIFGLNPHVMTKGHTAFNKVLREHEKLKDRKVFKDVPEQETNECQQIQNTYQKEHHSSHTLPKRTKKLKKKCNKGSKIHMLAKPVDFVARFSSQLSLSPHVTQHIHDVTVDVTKKRLVSDIPSLVTSACMLIVFKHDEVELSSADVQAVSNISHVTIDKCYKKLLVFYEDLVSCLS
jgi:transcription initiation factor TFIIIB Brf1 subunit/transcription initiation factor TFIIB